MPYSFESLLAKAKEPCVKEWVSHLNHNTKNYAHYFYGYYDWFIANGHWESAQRMLDEWDKLQRSDDKKERLKVPKLVHSYILARHIKAGKLKGKLTGISDRRNTWCAVASFFEFHDEKLPPLSRKDSETLFAPSEADTERALQQEQLSIEEVEQLIDKIPRPYDVALTVMFQGFMGLAEFNKFNKTAWRNIIEKDPDAFNKPGLLRVNLYRSKTSRGKISTYYTFLSTDAKKAISRWLKIRPQTDHPHLLVTKRKGVKGEKKQKEKTGTVWVPATPRLIGQEITRTAKRLDLIKEPSQEELWPGTRYHVHGHEFRDLAKSLSTLHGVKDIASEYFLGHTISSYEKSPKYDEEFFRNEYRKVEPYLNIVSNPLGLRNTLDEARRAAREEFVRLRLSEYYTLKQIEEMNISDMSKEDVDKRIREKRTATSRSQTGANGTQKVVPMIELTKWVEDGWEFIQALPTGQAVVRSTVYT